MRSSVNPDERHLLRGVDNSCRSESLQHGPTSETEDHSVFSITVELCGGLEQLTADKSKEFELRFIRRKKRNANFRRSLQPGCSSRITEKTQAVPCSLTNSGVATPQLSARSGRKSCNGAVAVGTSIEECSVSGPDTSARHEEEEEEAEETLPLYQVVGFLSSFVINERPDMFADAYEGTLPPPATEVAQRQQREEEDAKVDGVYPIEYVLPGGFSPPMQLRPGVLALINDIDAEVLGGMEAPVRPSDCVTFISTLHGG